MMVSQLLAVQTIMPQWAAGLQGLWVFEFMASQAVSHNADHRVTRVCLSGLH